MAESERSGSFDGHSGRLWTFGDNSEGALGDGTQSQIEDPIHATVLLGPALSPPVRFAFISAGLYHTLALADDGTVWSWGRGENGRLGHGSNEPLSRPKRIEAFDNNRVLAISAGYHHSIAINHKNQLYCWGSGWSGQLGLGDSKDEHKPVRLMRLDPPEDQPPTFVAVAAGYRHSIALTDSGRIYSWGSGDSAQLGHGPSVRKQPYPRIVESVKGIFFQTCSASEFHTVALTDEGILYSWGSNRQQQLGYGDVSLKESWKPQPVESGGVRFVSAAAGTTHTLAAGRDGLIWRWGRVPLSKVVIDRPQVLPGIPSGLGPIIEVATRTSHCLALTAKGDVLAWGYNEFGQAKPGSSENVEIPTVVSLGPTRPPSVSQIAAGGNHSVVVSFFGKLTIPPLKPTLSLQSSLSSLSGTPLSSAKSSPRSTPSPRGLAVSTERSGSLQNLPSPDSLPELVRQILAREEEIASLEQELSERKESILRKEKKLIKEKDELMQKERALAREREVLRKQLSTLISS